MIAVVMITGPARLEDAGLGEADSEGVGGMKPMKMKTTAVIPALFALAMISWIPANDGAGGWEQKKYGETSGEWGAWGDREPRPGAGDHGHGEVPPLVDLWGVMFRIYQDIRTTPGFSQVSSMAEARWQRPPLAATPEDCASLHSWSRPVSLNTHAALMKAGYMSHLPYLFREHCASASDATLGEVLAVATARNVWILPHGSMALKAEGEWHLLVPHPEYHSIGADAGIVLGEVAYASTAINLAQAHAHNFYHFVAEVIPRLLAVPGEILHDPGSRILLPPSSKAAFVAPLLRMIGIDASRAVSAHATGGLIFASRIFAPTFAPFRWHSEPPRTPLVAAWSVFKTSFAAGVQATGRDCDLPAVLFLGGAGRRSHMRMAVTSERGERGHGGEGEEREVVNWGQASAWIREGLQEGWVLARAEPGEYPLEQQACLFSRAEGVAGAHGSNLANMVWMRVGGRLVEVLKPADMPGPRHSNFWHVAAAMGLRHRAVVSSAGFKVSKQQATDIARFIASSG